MKIRNYIASAATAAVMVIAGQAGATTVDLTYEGFEVDPAQSVYLEIPGPNNDGTYRAGGFTMNDGTADFVAWCIDLHTTIGDAEYELSRPSQISDAVELGLNQLFTRFNSVALASAVNSAAFQVAIWEIIYDDGLDLTRGSFEARGNNAVTSLAQNWLNSLSGVVGAYDLTFFSARHRQDLVSGSPTPPSGPGPIPLPAGVVLLLGGLGAMGALRRRNKAS